MGFLDRRAAVPIHQEQARAREVYRDVGVGPLHPPALDLRGIRRGVLHAAVR
jgi:hypothetical protein